MKTLLKNLLFLIACSCLVTGCIYPSPDEEYLQETPTTNNPDVTRDNNSFGIPMG